jgi:hypothetical protein
MTEKTKLRMVNMFQITCKNSSRTKHNGWKLIAKPVVFKIQNIPETENLTGRK